MLQSQVTYEDKVDDEAVASAIYHTAKKVRFDLDNDDVSVVGP